MEGLSPSEPLGSRAKVAPRHLALAAIVGLAAVLDLRLLSQNGFANSYYSAAVRSMLDGLHNALFVASDPGGLLSVDKPPLALWLQAASAGLFGLSPLSLLLPEAILGVIAVASMYRVISRRFGPVAGLASALALAVFPAFVAVARDNNPDMLLALLCLAAGGTGMRAAETGRLRWLVGAAALVGLAFNTKMVAAFLVVPGIALAYLLCAPGGLRRRVGQLAAAGLVLVVVSASWITYVDLTPAGQRPWVGSTTDNSELALAVGYNGLGRVAGQIGAPGDPAQPEPGRPQVIVDYHHVFAGAAGPLRLFNASLGDQGGWILPFALLGVLAAGLSVRRRRDPRLAALIILGGWALLEVVVLSLSTGIVHPYYVSALAPGAAALFGVGAVEMSRLARSGRRQAILPALAIAVTAVVQVVLLRPDHYLSWWVPALLALAAVTVGIALLVRRWAPSAVVAAAALLLVAPAAFTKLVWDGPASGTFPAVGRFDHQVAGESPQRPQASAAVESLERFLVSHHAPQRFQLLTRTSRMAAPLILDGVRASPTGGFNGNDPALDAGGLARLVARGDARYVMLGGVFPGIGVNSATSAAKRACPQVPDAWWEGPDFAAPPWDSPAHPATLYDCAGRAAQLAQ